MASHDDMPHVTIPLAAVAWMLLAALGFAAMGTAVKAVSDDVEPVEVVFWRSVVSLVVALFAGRQAGADLWGVNRRAHVVRGLTGVGAMICYFTAITRLPVLGDAVLLTYLSPLLVASISRSALGEVPPPRVWAALLLGLVGVAIVVGPQGRLDPVGVAAGLSAAVLAAGAYTSVRVLTRTDSSHTIVLWFSAICVAVTSLGFLDGGADLSRRTVLLLGAIGGIGTLAQYALTRAYAQAEAARVSVFAYATPVFAYLLGLALLAEVPPVTSLVGAAVVVLAGVLAARP